MTPTAYSLLLGHGGGSPQDPPSFSSFSPPSRPVIVSQHQPHQLQVNQPPPPIIERHAQQGAPAPSSGIFATVGSAVGAAVRAMCPRLDAVSPRSAALIEETRQLELRVQAAQSSSALDEHRRRDEAYDAGIRHRDELRRRLQLLDQQISTDPAARGGYPPITTGHEFGSLSRRRFDANFNPVPPVHLHPHPQYGAELQLTLNSLESRRILQHQGSSVATPTHACPSHPSAVVDLLAGLRSLEIPLIILLHLTLASPSQSQRCLRSHSSACRPLSLHSLDLEVGFGWLGSTTILRAASRLTLVCRSHFMELARDAYSKFLRSPEHRKAFIDAAPSPDSDIEAALSLLAWAAVPAGISRRLAAVKR
jgi:hypothetical protein